MSILVALKCQNCGASHLPDSNFCNKCGYNLTKAIATPPINFSVPQSYTPKFLADKILTSRISMEGERKLVTVLFADVADYTSISEKLDPEEVHQIMDGCFKILMDEIHYYEGTINQFTGDGIMALFGAPVAHEDHAQRACYAALSIQKAIGEYRQKLEKDCGVDFKMRIGLNSGTVVVGAIGDDLRMDYTAVGDTTNLAARIQQSATPGEIWMSRETRAFTLDYFQDKPVGEIRLKGKTQPQIIYRVISERKAVHTRFEAGLVRGVNEFVGRRSEMESLQAAFERIKSREAQVVDIVGEAGVGKSRLVYEFQQSLGTNVTFLKGFCVHYGRNINFLPGIDVVRAAFGIEEEMTEKEAGQKIEEKATETLAPMIPFYRNLLSLRVEDPTFRALSPEGRKFKTFEAVKVLLLTISEEKPLVIFLEDVHWMDNTSEEFFTYFSRFFLDHPILMISAYRPEGDPRWSHGTRCQSLKLETLRSNSSMRLVRSILGGLALEPNLEQKIVEKTAGNPFFLEEIVRELLERGDLVKFGDRYICSRPIDQMDIPHTVQGVLAARMDRLSEDLKRTMQVASVIGRDFAFYLLKMIMELGDELRARLTNLVELEILYEKALYPELEYLFKHALTQEVAYETLLKQRRREIHLRVARTVEELHADRLEKHLEVLAHHYERSGNAEKAVEYLILAGEKSNRHYAVHAACEFFSKALEVIETTRIELDPQTKVRVHQELASASNAAGDIDKALEEYSKAIEISRRHGLIDDEMDNLTQLAMSMWLAPVTVMKAEALQFYEEAIARTRKVGNKAAESQILTFKGIYMCALGSRYQGYQVIVDAERIALEAGNQRAIFANRIMHAASERWLGRPQKTIALTEGMVETMRGTFNLSHLSGLIFIRGLALAEVGRIEDSIAILRDGIDICEKFGGEIHLGRLYNALGYCYREIHHPDRAWSLNMRSKEVARRQMEQYPMVRESAAEIFAQTNVNLMENLFDQKNPTEAWHLMESFRKESKSDEYFRARDRWEVRMDYLTCQILLHRNDLDPAEAFICKNLKITKREHSKKMEGCFLRLLGEVQFRRGKIDNSTANLKEAIIILKEVGNPRQLWQAHSSLGSVFGRLKRLSEAKEQWGAAAEIICQIANGISDCELRDGFLTADPIREILSKAES